MTFEQALEQVKREQHMLSTTREEQRAGILRIRDMLKAKVARGEQLDNLEAATVQDFVASGNW
jgi:hypothetical protein